MKTSTYIDKCLKSARNRARVKDYLINEYLSTCEVDRALNELKMVKKK